MAAENDLSALPPGPHPLCFNKDDFMKDEFHVDEFVADCRRRVQLETVRDDLSIYLKVLKNAMIELINKDYADFVNLSTNLVGMDKAINNLTVPLGQLKEEVLSVRTAIDEAIKATEEKLQHRMRIKEKKDCLHRLTNIVSSVNKIEKLLGIQAADVSPVHHTSELNGQLLERVGTEFNKLQFYVSKCRGLSLVEQIKPRISNITTTLQYSLEGLFHESLLQGQTDILRQCLRTYATIDKTKDAENLFRQYVVKPYMEQVITEEFIQANGQGLRGMFHRVLEFIPQQCKTLKEVTSGAAQSGGEVVRGYDFLVNAVWPEIVYNIEARTPSMFAPGNPDIFHEKYLISMDFLAQFERHCGSQASVKRLRAHPSYNTFMFKWSLPVYFQIRFQEVAGAMETGLFSPFSSSQEGLYQLHATQILWTCLHKCWSNKVFVAPLCHRFWKLSLQLVARYVTWIREVQEKELTEKPEEKSKPETKSNIGNGDETLARRTPSPAPAPPPITMAQIIALIADAHKLVQQLPSYFEQTIRPRLAVVGCRDNQVYLDSISDSQSSLRDQVNKFDEYIISELTNQCLVHLKMVNDIPRLYRRTNREVPSKASSYVSTLTRPLVVFVEDHENLLLEERKSVWLTAVLTSLTDQYFTITSDVLTSVKKMEDSLKRLKKARGSIASLGQGMSDDDKIRLQIAIDVDALGEQITGFISEKNSIKSYQKLSDMVEGARKSSEAIATVQSDADAK
ncbi:conserved oligomeric Golgi complex subunit 2-like [Lineus longissimus]|uniref:conserved oligomeric Golgi complex subunit 2-like n=1 Tax=Lineus longissimus TaxID=88925 RepID=UPI002B4D39B1